MIDISQRLQFQCAATYVDPQRPCEGLEFIVFRIIPRTGRLADEGQHSRRPWMLKCKKCGAEKLLLEAT